MGAQGARFTVGRKLGLLAAVAVVAAVVIGLVAYVNIASMRTGIQQRVSLATARAVLVDLDMQQSNLQIDERNAILVPTQPALQKQQTDHFTTDVQAVDQDWSTIQSLPLGGDTADLTALKNDFDAYVADVRAFVAKAVDLDPADPGNWALIEQRSATAAAIESKITAVRHRIEAESATSAAQGLASAHTVQTVTMVSMIVGALVVMLIAIWIARAITRPLGRVVAALNRVARRDYTVTVVVRSRDELGDLGRALNEAVSDVRRAIQAVGDSSSTIAAAAEELTAVSATVSSASEESARQADAVVKAAAQVDNGIQTVAAATEQLTAAVREIAQSATDAAGVAGDAATQAEEAMGTVRRLDGSSLEIGKVVKIITSIAEQTNLLALNATIEAARAGSSGKGFAVVAGEVKELAEETARATDEISRQVATIQNDTLAAVAAIERITAVIDRVNGYQTTIASAVEEQSSVTNEISRSVNDAAAGSGAVTANISGVATAAATTAEGSTATQQAAGDLSRLSTDLRTLVGQFTV
jgi:methyl-accepting chemotaxis protein